jgi:hypothetical protein
MSNTLSNYAFNRQTTEEIVCAYSSAPVIPVPEVWDAPTDLPGRAPWTIFGSFVVPQGVRGKLQVSGINTGPAIMTVVLFAPERIDGTLVDITAGEEQLHFSEAYDFAPGIMYQIAVQYYGLSGVGLVRTVSLVAP